MRGASRLRGGTGPVSRSLAGSWAAASRLAALPASPITPRWALLPLPCQPGAGRPLPDRPGIPGHALALVRATPAVCLLAASAALLTACGHALGAGGGIHVSGASIPLPASPGRADAYLDIRNNGPADQLVSARTSEGGTVTFRAPAAGSSAMRTVPDIPVPSHTTLRLVPNGAHLTITGARALPGGTQITLTLVFARAGKVSVPAVIANAPAS